MSKTLDKGYIEKKEKGSGEFQDLYLEGIEHLQNLSSAHWTDYNEHDPGITIFENLTYTLTNLSYKVDMPLIDILTESKKGELVSGDNGFFIASEILTSNPIIKEDYRKLLFDGIHNVKNVWINTHNQGRKTTELGKLNLQGLYHVFIEMYVYDEKEEELQKEEERVKNDVNKLFHAHRNLCEDLYDITVLRPFNLKMQLQLTLDIQADGEAVFGQVYYDINDFLTHEAKFESLWELQQQGESLDSIYEGPSLQHGFIEDDQLKEQKSKIYISDLTKIISKVPGVVSIDAFQVVQDKNSDHKPIGEKEIIVPKAHTPRFELPSQEEAEKNLLFKTAEIALVPNAREIKKRHVSIEAEHYGNFKTVSESLNTTEIPTGESLGISSYYSVREQFPAIYGIGRFGLPPSVTKKREAQAKQLKAFLLPFDQLMTNFLAQLNNVYTLFDTHETKIQSYFYQVLEDMNSLEEKEKLIKVDYSNNDKPIAQWKNTLARLNGNFDNQAIKRLNDVTDTLLARFAEDFPTYVLQKINTSCFGKNYTDEEFDKKLLAWKRKLISNYGDLSYNRSRSFDYFNKETDAFEVKKPIPVIVQKIAILLGIRHDELRNLSAVMKNTDYDVELILDAKSTDYSKKDNTIFKRLFDNIREYALRRESGDENLKNFFKQGVVDSNYQIIDNSELNVTSDLRLTGNKTYNLFSDRSISKIKRAKKHSITLLRKLNEKTEGIHLIEHILLVPPAKGNYFGFSFGITTLKTQDCEGKRIDFNHASLKSSEQRNKDIDAIKDAVDTINLLEFRVERSRDRGLYWIEIHKRGFGLLAISENRYNALGEADADMKALDRLQDRNQSYALNDLNYLVYFNDCEINESFFSFRMSFILPSWPVRFQEPSFEIQFNNILYQQVPIHIHYNTHWLGLVEMSRYEKAYFHWLELLTDGKKLNEQMDAAHELINILIEFQTLSDVA